MLFCAFHAQSLIVQATQFIVQFIQHDELCGLHCSERMMSYNYHAMHKQLEQIMLAAVYSMLQGFCEYRSVAVATSHESWKQTWHIHSQQPTKQVFQSRETFDGTWPAWLHVGSTMSHGQYKGPQDLAEIASFDFF